MHDNRLNDKAIFNQYAETCKFDPLPSVNFEIVFLYRTPCFYFALLRFDAIFKIKICSRS